MTPWDEVGAWGNWQQTPPDRQRDLLWTWRWCRPCSLRDMVVVDYWLGMAADGGAPRFLAHEEAVWMVELLALCWPSARLHDLDKAVGLFFGTSAASVEKRRTLHAGAKSKAQGGNARSWLAEAGIHVKARVRELQADGRIVVPPWDAAQLAWMAAPLSLHRADPTPLGPWSVSRWLPPVGMAWSVSHDRRPGYLIRCDGPEVLPSILGDLGGWNPPEIRALVYGVKQKNS